ncbi:MAG: phosphoenolpyruvate--protein phosphotransferase [Acidobacteriota bacterium]
MSPASVRQLRGRSLAQGFGRGAAIYLQHREMEVTRISIGADGVAAELERLRRAIEETQKDVAKTRSRIGELFGEEIAGIFEAHRLILEDSAFSGAVETAIREQAVNAEWAVHQVSRDLSERFAQIEDETLRERGQDLRDVTRYLLRRLVGGEHQDVSDIDGDLIVLADELTPEETLRLGRQDVVGFVVEKGGRNSHSAIVARALSVPMIAGVRGLEDLDLRRAEALVDGAAGTLVLHPSAEHVEEFEARAAARAELDRSQAERAHEVGKTSDGVRVELHANVEVAEEMADVRRFGAEGVGLYRSEFLYIERSPEVPTEEEHLAVLAELLKASAGPVVVRTFDLGGRKVAQEMLQVEERNPSLGQRGIRLTLARRETFRAQLRAIYRAAALGDLRVLLPMVGSIEDVVSFRRFAEEVCTDLASEGLTHRADCALGAMIEVPSAALMANELARHVDFLAIGTNDLVQYTLAVDRSNETVADYYQPLHPAVLRLLRAVSEAGAQAGVPVSLCGEIASSPEWSELLVGLGLTNWSMSPRSIPQVKLRLRQIDSASARALADRCLACESSLEVEKLLRR